MGPDGTETSIFTSLDPALKSFLFIKLAVLCASLVLKAVACDKSLKLITENLATLLKHSTVESPWVLLQQYFALVSFQVTLKLGKTLGGGEESVFR